MMSFAQDTLTTSTPSAIGSIHPNITVLNPINASVNCNLRLDESAVENILQSMHNHVTHVVEIHVRIDSKNETRMFPEFEWPWANEIGRTIISLKARTAGWSFPSSLPFITLTPGVQQVNVVVSELNYGSLPKGSNGLDLVFDFLLHRVSRSDETQDYKLCRPFDKENDVKQLYNCCRVASGGNVIICAEYSSVILEYVEYYILVMVILMVYVGTPLMYTWQYSKSVQMKTNYYEIADSPMALSTIFYSIFV